MVKKVVINGKIDTLLVFSEEGETKIGNPFMDVLNNQEERIDALERQNIALIEQGETLLNLLETSIEAKDFAKEALESLKEAESVLMEYEDQIVDDILNRDVEKK